MHLPESDYEFENEWEALPEWEAAYEDEAELEGDLESEQFFGRLTQLARQAGQSPALRRIGMTAARTALRGLGGAAMNAQDIQAAGADGNIGQMLGNNVPGWLRPLVTASELEMELMPQQSGQAEAAILMEHLGHAAAQTESEAEAEAFIGAMIPLAAQFARRAAPVIMRAGTGLIRGVANVARTLRNNPATRPMVRMIPEIVRNTSVNVLRQVEQGKPATMDMVVRALAGNTANMLSSPRNCARAWRRSRALDRCYHRAAARR